MPARSSRERMVRAAVELFRERGYAATSFHDVIERSGAPRGSIYHHFPEGKQQLAREAIQWYADRSLRALDRAVAAGAALEALDLFVAASRDSLVASDFLAGCAVAGVALDLGAADEPLRSSVAVAFGRWRDALADVFGREGATPERARRLAHVVVAAVEGALLLSRAQRDAQPIDDVAAELRAHVRAALAR
ncbi:TetR/AcrR family transcriptional regulator [Phytohabitans sp. ZYX-F-186]|uniref:TetR/AcrR family transcriptional regulator n=1 Tax=Phytohabitans maris TaxID=3071409 RepID=A0ABU0ZMZ9_9ACTN|nr:TetR/AcrR family transcriptional regulator [Phytohabitans sp. ZYX-F-186]MDQ7908333.1 TetR/AcrR family transcriptional regulator [Phytohabitans sp. ZYX-F-186]